MPTIEDRSRRLLLHVPLQVEGKNGSGNPFEELTETVNVSGTGAAFDLPCEVPVGTRVKLAFGLPEHLRPHFGGEAVYRVRGVVIRLEHVEGSPSFRTGVRFLLDDEP
jgi:hypothetical protein